MNGKDQGPGDDHGTDRTELTISDPLDLVGVRALGPVIDAALTRRPAELVIDMSACPLVDAAGIGLLLDTHRRMWRMGAVLTLRSPSPRIRRLFQVARVDQVFQVVAEPSETATASAAAAPDDEQATDTLPAAVAPLPAAPTVRATATVRTG